MSESAAYIILTYTSLLAIINPLSAIPVFLGMTASYSPAHRRHTLLRAVLTAWLVLVSFAVLGTAILNLFGITTQAFQIAGGILFFGIGMDMLQARRSRVKATEEEEAEGAGKADVGIVPLGIPVLAGPGAITTVVALVSSAPTWQHTLLLQASIFSVLITAWVLLGIAPLVFRHLGQTGLNVVTRLMGLLVMVVGVQFVINGSQAVVAEFITRVQP